MSATLTYCEIAAAAMRAVSEHLIVTDDGHTRTITMSRPEHRNRLTPEMYLAMSEAVSSAQSDPDIRCLVLTGRSGAFTAGDDMEAAASSRDAAQTPASLGFLQALESSQKPIVAAVDGLAIGIGVTMILHCDFVVADATATFSAPLHQRDGIQEEAAHLLVPRTIRHQRAFAMLVLGRSIDAEDARKAGFVNTVVPPGHALIEAHKVAREICALPAEAVAVSRRLLKVTAK